MGSQPAGQSGPTGETDWLAVYLEYEAGTPAEELAERLGYQVQTIRNRACHYRQVLVRLDINLPDRLGLHLSVAEQAIAAGQTADAERAAKAVLAVIRAARSLEQWRGDMEKDKPDSASETDADITIEELRAELEQKIARLIEDRARKAEMAMPVRPGSADPDEDELEDTRPG